MSKGIARFEHWEEPEFDDRGMTRWNWMCQHRDGILFGGDEDMGAFTYINARYAVESREGMQRMFGAILC